MNKELTIFEGIELEVLTKEDVNIDFNGECLFNGKQVAKLLDYVNDRDAINTKVRENQKIKLKNSNVVCKHFRKLNNHGETFLTEEGVLDLVCNSKTISNNKKDKFIEFLKNNNLIKHDRVLTNQRHEIKFLDKLEQALKPFYITGEKQYQVLNYRIDYYIPTLNIAIEYDENGHSSYTYEQHEGRQKEIEKELGCKFIRVTDNNSDEYNLGLVIKKIFNL